MTHGFGSQKTLEMPVLTSTAAKFKFLFDSFHFFSLEKNCAKSQHAF